MFAANKRQQRAKEIPNNIRTADENIKSDFDPDLLRLKILSWRSYYVSSTFVFRFVFFIETVSQ